MVCLCPINIHTYINLCYTWLFILLKVDMSYKLLSSYIDCAYSWNAGGNICQNMWVDMLKKLKQVLLSQTQRKGHTKQEKKLLNFVAFYCIVFPINDLMPTILLLINHFPIFNYKKKQYHVICKLKLFVKTLLTTSLYNPIKIL